LDAVRQALARLGNDAKPLAIRQFIKKTFRLDVSTDMISRY
jgi:hypothetical protein